MVLPTFSSDPAWTDEGSIYHNTTDHTTYVYDGTVWQALF
jgi:hypothetical protein